MKFYFIKCPLDGAHSHMAVMFTIGAMWTLSCQYIPPIFFENIANAVV